MSSRLRIIISAAVVVALVAVALVGYVAIGFAYAQIRIVAADRVLNTVVSHENKLNTAFRQIDSRFSSLGGNNPFNATQARALVDQFVSSSRSAQQTVNQDDSSLAAAQSSLEGQRWLTAVARGNLDRESLRIRHARNALGSARTVVSDYLLDGQFLQSFFDSLADLDTLDNQTASSDFTGAQATLVTMKAHVDRATELSTAPGLPKELHSMMVDFQSLVGDFGQLFTAAQANDDAGVTTAENALQNDSTKVAGYNFDAISAEVVTFYQPLVDRFNSEMAAATA